MNKKVNLSYLRSLIVTICFLSMFPITILAQTAAIKGTVIDGATGETLIGVSVAQKGTTNGVLTDLDGVFEINVPEGTVLVFGYVGYKQLDIAAASGDMTVRLESNTTFLDEVVVVGYGVQKKSVVTAAISSVKSGELGKVAPTRVDNVLRGQVSGVSITQASGQPGDGSKVRIRGIGTINNSDPLYIVDGMPIESGIDYLNPADIESVEILKDAASAAIYGTRGANGVILVTTKKGKVGQAVINYNMSYGWQRPWKHRDVLNGQQYIELINEMNGSGSIPSNTMNANTDWQKEIFNNDAPIVNHQLSVSGGNDKGNYYLSLGYLSQDGIIGGNYDRSNYDRYNVRLNNNYTLFDAKETRKFATKLQVGVNVSFSRIKSTGMTTNSEYNGILGNALMAPPIYPVVAVTEDQAMYREHTDYKHGVKDPNGLYYYIFGTRTDEIVNPLATLSLPGIKKNEDKFLASFWADLELYKGLNFKTSYGGDYNYWGNDYSSGRYYISRTDKPETSRVTSEMNRAYTWQVENTLTYNFPINNQHNVTALLGQSAKSYRYRKMSGEASALLDPSLGNIDASTTPETNRTLKGQMNPYHKLASYFGRLSYNFDERYMAELTLRRDGSTRFAANHKWANFPSISAGWNITNESFMEGKAPWLSSLKLRGSWGKNGNENIVDFNYIYLMEAGGNYPLGPEASSTMAPGITPQAYANPNTKWEESEQLNFGFDSRFLDGALSFTFDWFKKSTNGMLMTIPLPNYLGAAAPYANVGDMDNTGIELDLSYQFSASDFNFRVGANASYIKNELIKLGNQEGWANYDGGGMGTISRAENGRPFPFFYGRKTDGIFQNQAEVDAYVNSKGEKMQPNAVPGDVRFVDVTGDGSITNDDRTQIGKGMPDWTFGLNLYAEYKGVDLSANFQGTLGNDIYDATRRNSQLFVNLPSYALGRWHGEGTSNKYPRLAKDENSNWESSDLYVKDGSFLRLRTLQLGYTFPSHIMKRAYVQNLRLFVSAENLLTITSYEGHDPEISSGGTSLGIDRGIYPQARTFSVGANITF